MFFISPRSYEERSDYGAVWMRDSQYVRHLRCSHSH